MKRLAASLLALGLVACGGPSEEDVLTPDKIRASESAPELPDIQLSENPEPPPAPAEPAEELPLNELENEVVENEIEPPTVEGVIPAAFQARWAMVPEDCRPGDVVGTGLLVSPESIMTPESVGRLAQVVGDYPERFTGLFDFGGQQRQEELVLTGSSNTLIRVSGGQRLVYRRC